MGTGVGGLEYQAQQANSSKDAAEGYEADALQAADDASDELDAVYGLTDPEEGDVTPYLNAAEEDTTAANNARDNAEDAYDAAVAI